jgi:hypothetical protein
LGGLGKSYAAPRAGDGIDSEHIELWIARLFNQCTKSRTNVHVMVVTQYDEYSKKLKIKGDMFAGEDWWASGGKTCATSYGEGAANFTNLPEALSVLF